MGAEQKFRLGFWMNHPDKITPDYLAQYRSSLFEPKPLVDADDYSQEEVERLLAGSLEVYITKLGLPDGVQSRELVDFAFDAPNHTIQQNALKLIKPQLHFWVVGSDGVFERSLWHDFSGDEKSEYVKNLSDGIFLQTQHDNPKIRAEAIDTYVYLWGFGLNENIGVPERKSLVSGITENILTFINKEEDPYAKRVGLEAGLELLNYNNIAMPENAEEVEASILGEIDWFALDPINVVEYTRMTLNVLTTNDPDFEKYEKDTFGLEILFDVINKARKINPELALQAVNVLKEGLHEAHMHNLKFVNKTQDEKFVESFFDEALRRLF
jgi:hypothetical protein